MHPLDKDIFQLREDKKVLEALERLIQTPDFKKVFFDDFMTKHPLRLLKGKGALNLDPQVNQDIDRQLECVALFNMYLDQRISEIADIDVKILDAETLREQQIQGN